MGWVSFRNPPLLKGIELVKTNKLIIGYMLWLSEKGVL